MMYAVLFQDNEEHADKRKLFMQDHLAFLESNADQIKSAGPLFDSARDKSAGGLWVVDAPDPETVQHLVEADPFWPTGLRKSVRILQWTQVFADGIRRI